MWELAPRAGGAVAIEDRLEVHQRVRQRIARWPSGPLLASAPRPSSGAHTGTAESRCAVIVSAVALNTQSTLPGLYSQGREVKGGVV